MPTKGQSSPNEIDLDRLVSGPVRLDPANFTPRSRTPWGGTAIGEHVKCALVPGARGSVIGESWEFSCDPAFPSRLLEFPELTLADLIRRRPELLGGLDPSDAPRTCEVLVKLLHAASPLSLQVHPEDGDPALLPSECGKPESWLVLDAEPGAGIYLGFSRPLSRAELGAALRDPSGGAHELLHFEPARPGDYFEIGPGVAHAIAPGVLLLEPQRVLEGLSGKTYRLWDWGRKYDEQGRLDPRGTPRELHLDAGLRLIDPERQVGPEFAASLRRTPDVQSLEGVLIRRFPPNRYYQSFAIDMQADARLSLTLDRAYGAFVPIEGALRSNEVPLVGGQPALLPLSASPLQLLAETACRWTLVIPASGQAMFS